MLSRLSKLCKKNNDCNSLKYEFMLLSEEELKKKYGGNYYYAMH